MATLKYRPNAESPWTIINGIKGDKGDPGKDGKDGLPGEQGPAGTDGKTPERGVDYWTTEDQESIVSQVLAQIADYEEVSF